MSKALELKPSDIRRLGSFYTNDFPLEVESGQLGTRIVASTKSTRGIVAMTVVLFLIAAAFFASAVYLAWTGKIESEVLGIVAIPCVLAIVGPAFAHTARRNHLQKKSPFLDFDRERESVSILAGEREFPLAAVYGLLGITILDGDQYTELQLIIVEDNQLRPYLLRTSISGSAEAEFGKQLRQFGNATGLRAFIAAPEGVFMRGPLRITELIPPHSAAAGTSHP